jgi:hypothetical protein
MHIIHDDKRATACFLPCHMLSPFSRYVTASLCIAAKYIRRENGWANVGKKLREVDEGLIHLTPSHF